MEARALLWCACHMFEGRKKQDHNQGGREGAPTPCLCESSHCACSRVGCPGKHQASYTRACGVGRIAKAWCRNSSPFLPGWGLGFSDLKTSGRHSRREPGMPDMPQAQWNSNGRREGQTCGRLSRTAPREWEDMTGTMIRSHGFQTCGRHSKQQGCRSVSPGMGDLKRMTGRREWKQRRANITPYHCDSETSRAGDSNV